MHMGRPLTISFVADVGDEKCLVAAFFRVVFRKLFNFSSLSDESLRAKLN
jgi:hypothetical protein